MQCVEDIIPIIKQNKKIEINNEEICNSITTVQKDSMVIEKFLQTTNELIFVGGVESNKWLDDGKSLSRNFKQGYRVYDSNGIACSQTTNGGGLGSYTGLYIVY